jgi:radical SAM superfamily enzyme YgiQ (UPF0313 family)
LTLNISDREVVRDLDKIVDWAMVGDRAHANNDIFFGAFVWNEPYVQHIMAGLRQAGFPGRIGVGGPQVTYAEAGSLERLYPHADLFVRGFAEDALVSVAQGKSAAGILLAGAAFDTGKQAHIDLAATTSPWLSGILKPSRFVRWETQRGCPFRCSFCQHRAPNNFGVHRMLPARIEAEIEILAEASAGREIAVLDPTFNTADSHAIAILDALRMAGYQGRLSLQVRPEKLTRRFLDAIADFPGGVTLEFGIQTAIAAELELIGRIAGSDPGQTVDKVQEKLALVAG